MNRRQRGACANRVTLVETRRGCEMCETTPRYDVMLDGRCVEQLTWNTRGYVGYLPIPVIEGNEHAMRRGYSFLSIGERPIAHYHRELKKVNREWETAERIAARVGCE